MNNDPALGMAEFAERTGIKLQTLYVMASRGQLPPPDGIVSGRTKWWRADTIDEWAKTRRRRG